MLIKKANDAELLTINSVTRISRWLTFTNDWLRPRALCLLVFDRHNDA